LDIEAEQKRAEIWHAGPRVLTFVIVVDQRIFTRRRDSHSAKQTQLEEEQRCEDVRVDEAHVGVPRQIAVLADAAVDAAI
jgi:hypothetical protein